MTVIHIREIANGDWDSIVALEAGAYSADALSESREALESRARVSPGTCRVLAAGQRIAGYLLALPYPMFRYPELAMPEQTRIDSANLHLHDLVVAECFRGRGLARRLLGDLTAIAGSRRYERISLIAVSGSHSFWSANGYEAHPEVSVALCYGVDAVYMSRLV
jgi:ribosomal protein S18 acetylase RimI-like enzyme